MPIPKKEKGEQTDVFLSRCIKQISDEYPREQAYAICQGQLSKEEMKKTEDIFVLAPKKSENRGKYLSRCSAHSKMRQQFPNMKERMGQCLNAFNSYYKYWSKLEEFGEKDTEGTVLGDCIAREKAKGFDYREAYQHCASKVVVQPSGGSNPQVIGSGGSVTLSEENDLIVEPVFGSDDVSVDFDDTFDTERGKKLVQQLIDNGVRVHVITRRQQSDSKPVYELAQEYGIPKDDVHFTNGKLKWELIKKLGIKKHIDNNPDEIKAIQENVPEVEAIKFSDLNYT